MKDSLGWLPLQNRRLVNRLTFMHKTIHGQHGYILPPYADKPKRPTRTHHKYNYNLIRAQTDAYLYSYLPKTIKAWNSLPNNISNTTDIDSFRTILLNDMRNGNVQVVHRSIQRVMDPLQPHYFKEMFIFLVLIFFFISISLKLLS